MIQKWNKLTWTKNQHGNAIKITSILIGQISKNEPMYEKLSKLTKDQLEQILMGQTKLDKSIESGLANRMPLAIRANQIIVLIKVLLRNTCKRCIVALWPYAWRPSVKNNPD